MSLVTVGSKGEVLDSKVLPNKVCENNMVCFVMPDADDEEPESQLILQRRENK